MLTSAKRVIDIELQSIELLKENLNQDFSQAVDLILKSSGRVVVTGVGKSALIGQKIVATLNSTGTPSMFMHAADAIHGDLGMVQQTDIVLCISNSGNTSEIKALIPFIKKIDVPIIALTGAKNAFLAKQADHVLCAEVRQEACPNNLAPTSSTTAQLVLGDALAVCLLESRGFGSDDFARVHPGGSLGKKVYLRCRDLADKNLKPAVELNTPFKEVVMTISKNRLGVSAVLEQGKIKGVITDGDIRRSFQTKDNVLDLHAKDIMSTSPQKIEADSLVVNALDIFEKSKISQLLVVDHGNYYGVIHFHDLLAEGLV